MALPYENASTGKRAIEDIQKMLRQFGCKKFATGEDFDTGELFVQFEHRGQVIHLAASAKGYAAAWLREHPHGPRTKRTPEEHEAKALEIGAVAVYSVLRDWIKGQVTAIEIGILTFEAAFLSHIMLPSGKRVIEEVRDRKMLAAPKESDD